MRNFWDTDDIDFALGEIKGHDVIDAIKKGGRMGTVRSSLITDSCAMLFANPKIQEKFPESSKFLGQVYRHMSENGYLTPKE